jgi:tocopherol O-methyltransferase
VPQNRGQHIHHGYFKDPNDTKEQAQVNLANKLLEISALGRGSKVLDVGCGIGGTTRLLAKTHGCTVTGITISGHQVNMARRLTAADVNSTSASKPAVSPDEKEFMHYPDAGATRFIELDAHEMGKHFEGETFDCIWICEALYHLRDKDKFFSAAYSLLAPGGSSFVLAEWFKAPNLSEEQEKRDIAPIEAGMLSQRLCTIDDYLRTAEKAGFRLRQEPINISSQVAKTW